MYQIQTQDTCYYQKHEYMVVCWCRAGLLDIMLWDASLSAWKNWDSLQVSGLTDCNAMLGEAKFDNIGKGC